MMFSETNETSHKLFGVGKKTHNCPIRELERISLKSAYTDEFLKQQEEHGKSWFMIHITKNMQMIESQNSENDTV